MAITKVINDAVDLNQTSDYSGLRLPVGTTGDVMESFTTDYLVVGGGGGSGTISGAGGAGGLRTSYNNSTTTTNSLSFPSGKTAVATYMLNNNANDVSGNYNGTATNITYNTGKYGGAAVFNGSSSYIESGISTDILNSDYTISFWGKSSNSSGGQTFINTNNLSAVAFVRIDFSADGNLYFYHRNSASTTYVDASIVSGMADGNWHHVVITKDNTSVKAYKDGSLVGTITSTSGTYSNSTTLQIGRNNYNANGANNFDGDIDQVRIYNTALDSTDVSNIYNNEAQANSGGGAVAESSLTLTEGVAYDVTVGAGGAAVNLTGGNNGGNSIFSTITSLGGGFGGLYDGSAYVVPGNGGSGGGGSLTSSLTRGNGTLNQGYEGGYGDNSGPPYSTGGGGGAASPGQNSPGGNTGGTGGSGLEVNIIGGSGNYYAGGGGGAGETTGASGGIGGGGDGSGGSNGGEDGAFNTGGGAGGWRAYSRGFNGGSGVVILRYPTASVSSFTTTGTLNTPSTTNTVADNNYPVTNTAYYQLDGNANGYLTTNDLGTLDYPSGTGCVALYELNGNANGYLTTTDLSTVNYPAGADCIALYELNGNANDTSNTYNGSATNVTYNTGAFDQAAVFNGSSSYIDLGTSLLGSKSAFSVSIWVNFDNLNTQNFIFYNSESGTGGNLGFYDFGNGNIYFQPDASTSANRGYISNSGIYTTGEWVHIVMVFDGSETGNSNRLKAYIQGAERTLNYDGTIPSSTGTSTANSWIGGRSSTKFSGDIDQVRIFNTALTQAQVTTLARGVGSAYNGAENSITYNTGAFGQAAVFNGSSSYIDLNNTFANNVTQQTWSAWAKFDNLNTQNFILFNENNGGGDGFGFFTWTNGDMYFQSDNTTNSNRGVASSSGLFTTGEWVHFAMVYDGTATGNSNRLKAYVNANPITLTFSGTIPSNTNSTSSTTQIGGRGGGISFSGSIDQVRIFNTALTANNITTLARGVGTAYNGAASNITWANGRFGQAAVFNGSSSYIFNSNRSATQTDTISISAWIKTSDTSTSMMIVQTESIWVRSDYILRHDNYNGTGNYRRYNYSQSTVATDNWVHVCVVRDGTSVTLYVNNTAITFNSESTSSNSGVYDGISIGARNRSSDSNKASYFDGKIDQVRIYSTALTSSQVTQLYNEHYQTKFTDGSDTAIVFTEGTGTVTFSGVGPASPQGALRTNTSYSEDGSASVIEHYNGTDWKYFDAIKYCTTNTLNFPSGAGCIASYNLDNNVDDIGNTYNGTNSNVTFTASGKFGAAAVFNGSNARIDISNVLSGFTNVYTFSIWAKIDNTNNFSFFSSTASTAQSTYNNLIRFALHQNGNYYFSFGDIYGGRLTGASPSSWRDGNWHNFVFVSTSTQKLAYVDGSLFDSTSSTKAVSGLTNIILGHYGTNYADGLIDQVRIFNDSLTSDEVSKLYNNEVACS